MPCFPYLPGELGYKWDSLSMEYVLFWFGWLLSTPRHKCLFPGFLFWSKSKNRPDEFPVNEVAGWLPPLPISTDHYGALPEIHFAHVPTPLLSVLLWLALLPFGDRESGYNFVQIHTQIALIFHFHPQKTDVIVVSNAESSISRKYYRPGETFCVLVHQKIYRT